MTSSILYIIQERKSVDKLAEEVRTTLKCIISLTYNCTEEQRIPLKEMNDELSRLMATFKESLPQEEGLLIRPEIRKALKRSRQIKSAATIASRLPTKAKRGRKKAKSSYRNRVGWKAQVLRKVSAVHINKIYQTPTII